uniref:TIL domain-containing protein n=1 Tax=Phlebotomus papatasi TaxID=29031 RepID=A0A1B0D8Q9_PHLPP
MYAAVVFLALFGTLASAEFNSFPTAGVPYNSYSSSYGSNSNLQCNKEFEYYDKCASPCEETCYNTQNYYELKNKDECSLRNCVPRCKCVSGYVRNNNDRCVPKNECKGNMGFQGFQGYQGHTGSQSSQGYQNQGYQNQGYQGSQGQDYHHNFRGNRQPHFFYPTQQFDDAHNYDNFPQQGNQYDAGNYYNDYNKY